MATRRIWQCTAFDYQVSLTAGTVRHKTHTPLHLWFCAAYLMTTGTPGSPVQLQRQLGLSWYQMTWTMLHKLRRAMTNPNRTLLAGEFEVHECEVGGREPGRRNGRSLTAKAAEVIVAVEVREVLAAGTHRSVSSEHLQAYLDEFTFRYNRRGTPMAAFQTMLGLETRQDPATYRQIVAQGPTPNEQPELTVYAVQRICTKRHLGGVRFCLAPPSVQVVLPVLGDA